MARLIDADKLMSSLGWLVESGMTGNKTKAVLKLAIQTADGQTPIDAEPVVRCKDCVKWHDVDYDSDHFCEMFLTENENGYCSWGERREDEIDNAPTVAVKNPNDSTRFTDGKHYSDAWSINLPTVKKHGHWIERTKVYPDLLNDTTYNYECSNCGYWDQHGAKVEVPYCWHCGAKMDEDELQELEINPCRGCDDYDGQGGCKSKGGCGAKMNEVEHGNDI